MKKRLRAIQKKFTLSITSLVMISLCVLVSALVFSSIVTYKQQVSTEHINELVADKPDVAAYISSQKLASPHFVTLATKVKQEQQRQLLLTALLVGLPVIVVSFIVGSIIAKKLIRPVEDSFQAQERFIQDAAHELRNPLAAISVSLEAANIKKNPTKQDYNTLLQKLERQTKQLIRINEDLLFLQKKAEAYSGKTNVSELTRTVLTSYAQSTKEKNIHIRKEIQTDIIVAIRPKDYEIVVRNLLDNAVKYSPHGGEIHLVLHTKGGSVLLQISDSGIGIPTTEIELVTKRFYRASNTGSVPGSGLGLSLVQKVVDSYKGSLELVSHKGTTATATFKSYTKN